MDEQLYEEFWGDLKKALKDKIASMHEQGKGLNGAEAYANKLMGNSFLYCLCMMNAIAKTKIHPMRTGEIELKAYSLYTKERDKRNGKTK